MTHRPIWTVILACISILLSGGEAWAQAPPRLSTSENPEATPPACQIVINVPSRTLDWECDGRRVKTYPVGVGRPGFPTPLGSFRIVSLVVNPGWEHPYRGKGKTRIPPGSRNPLGTRWMGFHHYKGGEYGIHGTDRPSSVGRFSSHGCVRMRIKEAEDLFKRLKPNTPVLVRYEVLRVTPTANPDIVKVQAFPDVYRKRPDKWKQFETIVRRDLPEQAEEEAPAEELASVESVSALPDEEAPLADHRQTIQDLRPGQSVTLDLSQGVVLRPR